MYHRAADTGRTLHASAKWQPQVGSPYDIGVKHDTRTDVRLRDYLRAISSGEIYNEAGQA